MTVCRVSQSESKDVVCLDAGLRDSAMSHDTESTTHPATRLDDDDPVPGQDNPAHDTTLLPSGIESPDADESANRCSQSPDAYIPYDTKYCRGNTHVHMEVNLAPMCRGHL